MMQKVASDLLFQEILKLNLACRTSPHDDMLLIPQAYKRVTGNYLVSQVAKRQQRFDHMP